MKNVNTLKQLETAIYAVFLIVHLVQNKCFLTGCLYVTGNL